MTIHIYITTTKAWITDVYGPQTRHPNDLNDPLTTLLANQQVGICCSV